MSQIRRKAAQGLQPGDTFTVSRTLSQEDTLAFGRLTRDYNPVHYDEAFARGKGLSGLICHGLLTGGMICQLGGQMAWLASGMSFRFKRPVYLGDTITCRMVITEIDAKGRAKAQAEYTNQHGQVVAEVHMTGQVPGPGDQERLREMMAAGDPTNPLADS
jgi:acyl dehydratase